MWKNQNLHLDVSVQLVLRIGFNSKGSVYESQLYIYCLLNCEKKWTNQIDILGVFDWVWCIWYAIKYNLMLPLFETVN